MDQTDLHQKKLIDVKLHEEKKKILSKKNVFQGEKCQSLPLAVHIKTNITITEFHFI